MNTTTHTARLKYLAALVAALAGSVHASGFALVEANASGLGNAYAGQAAVAQDASTVYFNPAGMTLLPDSQIVVVGHMIKPKAEFSGTVTPNVGGSQGGDAGSWAFVPNLYYAAQLTPAVHVGLGINSPFGLKTEYDPGWMGRYQAIKSDVKTVNVNPSIAYKVSDTFSIGVGLNVQRIDATLTNFAGPYGTAQMKGDDYGYGYNLGALWRATPSTRIGVSYRSKIDYTLRGDASFSTAPAANGKVTADVTLPDSASLSIFHTLSPRWDLLADATWTGWNKFDKLAVYRTSGSLLSYTPENWHNIMRYSLGTSWHANDRLSLRGGIAYDESVMSDVYRTPRIPDGPRTWLAIGGQYRMSGKDALDFGYAHLFVKDVSINAGTIPATTTLTGTYNSSVDIISVQYTHTF
jgi:long-chain fatty acid transport protein